MSNENKTNGFRSLYKVFGLSLALAAGTLALNSIPAAGIIEDPETPVAECHPEAGSCGRVGGVECCRLCSGSIVCGDHLPPMPHTPRPGRPAPRRAAR